MNSKYKYVDCTLGIRWKQYSEEGMVEMQECMKKRGNLEFSHVRRHGADIRILNEDELYNSSEFRKLQNIATKYHTVMFGSVEAIDQEDGHVFLCFPYRTSFVVDGTYGDKEESNVMIQKQRSWWFT